jgi:hypothetical protein
MTGEMFTTFDGSKTDATIRQSFTHMTTLCAMLSRWIELTERKLC